LSTTDGDAAGRPLFSLRSGFFCLRVFFSPPRIFKLSDVGWTFLPDSVSPRKNARLVSKSPLSSDSHPNRTRVAFPTHSHDQTQENWALLEIVSATWHGKVTLQFSNTGEACCDSPRSGLRRSPVISEAQPLVRDFLESFQD